MAQTSNLELLPRLRDAVDRARALELTDLDRQIRELDRSRAAAHTTRGAGREHTVVVLRVLQQAGSPLPPREIAQRLGADPQAVSRWLAAARRQGYVERIDGAEKERNLIMSYQHLGQHSLASPELVRELRPATPTEYADLLAELKSIGYHLCIQKGRSSKGGSARQHSTMKHVAGARRPSRVHSTRATKSTSEAMVDRMIGRHVKSGWHGLLDGEILQWEPFRAGGTDVLVKDVASGRSAWYTSHGLTPIDGGGPLPSRAKVRELLPGGGDGCR